MTGARGARLPVGEIVAVTTTTFTAQSYTLNEAPPFGSLLRVAARELTGGQLGAGGPNGYNASRLEAGGPGGRDETPALSQRYGKGVGPGGNRIAAYYALCYGTQTGSIEPV